MRKITLAGLVVFAVVASGCSMLDRMGPGVPACAATKDTVPIMGRNSRGVVDTLGIAIFQKGCSR